MDTLSFSTQTSRPNLYMDKAFGLDSSQYSDHLGILNAEQFDDGRTVMRANEASEMRVRQQAEPPMPFGITGGPKLAAGSEENDSASKSGRKKKRASAEINGVEEDWALKKARGRPRVDTKDETAADVSLIVYCCDPMQVVLPKQNCFTFDKKVISSVDFPMSATKLTKELGNSSHKWPNMLIQD